MNQTFVKWCIVLSFVFDALNSVLQYYSIPFDRVSVIFRAFFEISIFIIFLNNKKFSKYYLFIIYLVFIFLISYLILVTGGGDNISAEPFVIINKYLYFIALSLLFLQYENESFKDFLIKAFKYYLVINSILIVLGFLFNIELFSSYFKTASVRFGYKGLIPSQNEVTGVYFFGLAFLYRRYFLEKNERLITVLLITFASILIGTKGIWISVLFFVGYYLLRYRTKQTFLVAVPGLVLIISVWGVWIWENIYHKYLSYFIYFLERSEIPLYSVLLSGRDLKIIDSVEYLSEYGTFWNYIFGGLNLHIINSETDLIDGYLLFGVNFLIYLVYYLGFYFRYDRSFDNFLVFLLFLVLAFTGGHMIYSAIVPLFYLMYVFTYNLESKREPIKSGS